MTACGVDYDIEHTDAFAWLDTRRKESVHAVVTDPPYGIVEYRPDQLRKRKSGSGGIWRIPMNYDGQRRSPQPRFTVLGTHDLEAISAFHGCLARLLESAIVPGGHVIMASQNLLAHLVIKSFVANGFELRGQIARVVKTLRGGDRPKGAHTEFPTVSVSPRSCWEPWLVFRKPCEGRVKDNLAKWGTGALRRPEEHKPFADLIESSPARGVERRISPHPSLKPQAFMRQIVRASLPLTTGVVLDPFMGSGSTIAAACACGYRSIGLEINRDYYTMAEAAIPKLAELETQT